ncbi:MAG: hypothetical protein C4343_03005, partial [Chloroflexota bacterium]
DWVRPGAVVVDFGYTVLPTGAVAGDVDFASAQAVAGAITPVPGGVGPVTNALLMTHVVRAAQAQVAAAAGRRPSLVPVGGTARRGGTRSRRSPGGAAPA